MIEKVLGTGPAGYVAAIRAAQLGADVILIEEHEVGGVCMNVVCIPTKALLVSSDAVNQIRKSKEFGIDGQSPGIHWERAVERKNRIVKSLGQRLLQLLNSKNITILGGKGTVIVPDKISVRLTTSFC